MEDLNEVRCCEQCDAKATHILVDYNHQVLDEGRVYCVSHAFGDGREQCPSCYDYTVEFENGKYLPTYPLSTLDGEGCCSEHP